jgi:hypothetical protein
MDSFVADSSLASDETPSEQAAHSDQLTASLIAELCFARGSDRAAPHCTRLEPLNKRRRHQHG